MAYLLQGNLWLGLEYDIRRHTGDRSAERIAGPVLGQIKTIGDGQASLMGGHRQTDGNLAVVLLAQLTAILSRHTDEWLPFFGNPVSSMIQAWIGSSLVIDGNTCSR